MFGYEMHQTFWCWTSFRSFEKKNTFKVRQKFWPNMRANDESTRTLRLDPRWDYCLYGFEFTSSAEKKILDSLPWNYVHTSIVYIFITRIFLILVSEIVLPFRRQFISSRRVQLSTAMAPPNDSTWTAGFYVFLAQLFPTCKTCRFPQELTFERKWLLRLHVITCCQMIWFFRSQVARAVKLECPCASLSHSLPKTFTGL